MKFVLIIPTYNEKGNIKRTVDSVQSVFKEIVGHDLHILVTDANSPDGTKDVVKEMQRSMNNLHLLVENAKRGLGAAYTDAMNYAFNEMKADAVTMFDADLSHDQNLLPKMYELISKGNNYVLGSRYKKGGGIPEEWGIHRKILSFGGNLFARILYFDSRISDFTSGYKTFTRDVFNKIKHRIENRSGYTFALATTVEPFRSGYKPVELPYHFKDRIIGQSKMTPEYFINAFKYLVIMRFGDFIGSRFGKVFVSGGIGACSQLIVYLLFHTAIEERNIFVLPFNTNFLGFELHPRFLLAQLLSIEVGLTASFAVNNYWAFGDKRLHGYKLLRGYIKNHFVVTGGIIIQLIIGQILSSLFGVGLIQNYVYQVIGILVGLMWNFYFYKKVVWKV